MRNLTTFHTSAHDGNRRSLLLRPLMLLLFELLTLPTAVEAAVVIPVDDVRSVSVGMLLRTSFTRMEGGTRKGSSDFRINHARFYLNGRLHEAVGFMFSTDQSEGEIRLLDAVLKFNLNRSFNVWFGQFLIPSDRSYLSDPNAWDFPFVQKYPARFRGRDTGAAMWGDMNGGRFKYHIGAFEGMTTNPDLDDTLLYMGRLTLNLWDPEPGFYVNSTYFGAADIFALGLVGMSQKDVAGNASDPGNFMGWNVDLLVERSLGEVGVVTLEGAYYHYDWERLGPPESEGSGYFVLSSYLLPWKVDIGKWEGRIQSLIRYQKFRNDAASPRNPARLDLGLSYILNGHNARITVNYSRDHPAAGPPDINIFKIGLQFRI